MEVNELLIKHGFETDLIKEILDIGYKRKFKAGAEIIGTDKNLGEIPIVLEGLLKVSRKESHDREVFLYYLEGGETCAMSINCCLEGVKSSFRVIAEEEVVLWMIPMTFMDSWIAKYRNFRKFVFRAYQARFDELLHTIDSIAFTKLDERLFKYLLDTKEATGSYEIYKTHEQIAKELSTSRVVISRLLKKLEKEDKIEQHRNRIDIL